MSSRLKRACAHVILHLVDNANLRIYRQTHSFCVTIASLTPFPVKVILDYVANQEVFLGQRTMQ